MTAASASPALTEKVLKPGLRGVANRFVWSDLQDADDDIRIERAKVLVGQTISGEVLGLAVALAFSTIYVPAVGLRPYLIWLALMVTGFEARRIMCKRLLPVTDRTADHLVKIVAVTSWVMAFVITAPTLIWLGQLSGSQQTFVLTFQLMWVVAGVTIIGIAPRTYQIYMVLSLGLVLAGTWLWMRENNVLTVLTVAVLFGSVAVWRMAALLGKSLADTVTARTQNNGLIAKLEVALARASELQAARSRFLASASHDLLQPIQTLLLLAPMVNSTTEATRRNELSHQLSATVASIDGMFRGFLEFARIEVGAITPKLVIVDLRLVLQRIAATLQPRCAAKNLTLVVDLPEQSLFAKVDVVLIDRVLQNIADNAVKYTPAGSVRLGVRISSDASRTEISVEDTGGGISREEQGEVGKPFFRGAAALREDVSGTGLGLANSHLLLDMMAGSLKLQPGSHGGCLATITFTNETRVTAPAGPISPAKHETVKFKRIALLEDDTGVRRALSLMLKAHDCEVASAMTGAGLREHFDQGFVPDFLIADYALADQETGIEAIQTALVRFPDLPAALVSGSVIDPTLIPKGVAWLPKPVDHLHLLRLLSQS